MIMLDPEKAGGPYVLTIKGNNTVTFSNVLVGEVWVCSGQSNMEFRVSQAMNSAAEIAEANYPQIRHIKIPNTIAITPKDDISGGDWKICSPATAGDFTAVGYFFARELYNKLHVPIGLINTSWGGTHVETWTSRKGFEGSDEFRNMIASMPVLNLDSIAAIKKAAMAQKIIAVQGSLTQPGETTEWTTPDFDDSKWPVMQLPGVWESKGLPDLDGLVWFRKRFMVSAQDAGKEGVIELAMIDDNDDTYINGVKVGSTHAYNEKRKYIIPAGVLKAGKNEIAVRVEDTGGGGGIYGDSADMKVTVGGDIQPVYGYWNFKIEQAYTSSAIGPNSYPTLLFNAMVNPLIPYSIQGVLWYQGESNAGRAYQYRKAFPLMIQDWRWHWGEGDFPFFFVQLASFNSANGNSNNGSNWAELREAQTMTLSLNNTGMAITTDIGNATNIHPTNKQDVGKRLAAIALNKVYGKKVVYSGPTYQSMKTDGNKIILSFTNKGGGLVAKNGELHGFEIAGGDHKFYTAKAVIDGDNIIVSADSVASPASVHFAWADFAGDADLYNKEGFPAVPFRTDDWKEITRDAKFAVE
jgi:sialate O-acetylesterase